MSKLLISPLMALLIKSGTGIIEGNYKSNLGMEDLHLKLKEEGGDYPNISVHFSTLDCNYLGKYTLGVNKIIENSISCELLTTDGTPYTPMKGFGDTIYIVLSPFENDLGGCAGRFIVDFGSPTAEVLDKDFQ